MRFCGRNWKNFNPRSRGGSDSAPFPSLMPYRHFNPRSRGGSDLLKNGKRYFVQRFQSTLPRRERHVHHCYPTMSHEISIHAPAEGATPARYTIKGSIVPFQSTLPRRERPAGVEKAEREFSISIHAPAEGATTWIIQTPPDSMNFNPRSRGGSDFYWQSGNI